VKKDEDIQENSYPYPNRLFAKSLHFYIEEAKNPYLSDSEEEPNAKEDEEKTELDPTIFDSIKDVEELDKDKKKNKAGPKLFIHLAKIQKLIIDMGPQIPQTAFDGFDEL